MNTQSGHIKGHQNSTARVIATGKYDSRFNYEDYEQKWRQALRRNLVEIHQKVLERTISSQRDEKTLASIVHLELINNFYSPLALRRYSKAIPRALAVCENIRNTRCPVVMSCVQYA